tara:strand:+ start:1954 stop:2130 length:177 start_codon:yes stop_codon:yes gene_type:complete
MVWKIFGLIGACAMYGIGGAMVGASVSSFRHYAGWDEGSDELAELKEIKKSKSKGGKK